MSKFKSYDEEEAREKIEAAAEEIDERNGGNEEERARVKVRDGMNVFWILPRIGEMVAPIIPMNIHYSPFHRCGRVVTQDPNDPEKLKSDGFFECHHCTGAWEQWKGNDCPGKGNKESKHPSKVKFLQDMPSTQYVANAVQLDGFFGTDRKGKYAVPDTDLMEEWGETFVSVMNGEEEPPENMPEDLAEAAKAGVQPLLVNEDVGRQIEDVHYDYCKRQGEDPLLIPDQVLLQISRSNKDETFTSNGQTRNKKNYSVTFTVDDDMGDWQLPDGLFEACEEQAQDLTDPDCGEDDLRERALALEVLDEDEMKEYLESCEHTFDPEFDSDSEEDDTPDYSEFADSDNGTMDKDKKKELEEMKAQMHGDD